MALDRNSFVTIENNPDATFHLSFKFEYRRPDDVEVAAMLLNENARLAEGADFIFYNNKVRRWKDLGGGVVQYTPTNKGRVPWCSTRSDMEVRVSSSHSTSSPQRSPGWLYSLVLIVPQRTMVLAKVCETSP